MKYRGGVTEDGEERDARGVRVCVGAVRGHRVLSGHLGAQHARTVGRFPERAVRRIRRHHRAPRRLQGGDCGRRVPARFRAARSQRQSTRSRARPHRPRVPQRRPRLPHRPPPQSSTTHSCWNALWTCMFCFSLTWNEGRSQGERGETPSPRNRKNCCRKLALFPKALFLVTNFRKIK